jgi:hypothetical protein
MVSIITSFFREETIFGLAFLTFSLKTTITLAEPPITPHASTVYDKHSFGTFRNLIKGLEKAFGYDLETYAKLFCLRRNLFVHFRSLTTLLQLHA